MEQTDINELLGFGLSKIIQPINFLGKVEDFINNEELTF